MSDAFVLELPDESATEDFARGFARCARPPLVIFLAGEVGVGKTTWARAVLRAWGWTGSVRSPTYTLLESYENTAVGPVHHLDLYRIRSSEELTDLGLADLWPVPAIWFIEWPEQGKGYLPPPDLVLDWSHEKERRQVRLTATSAMGENILAELISL